MNEPYRGDAVSATEQHLLTNTWQDWEYAKNSKQWLETKIQKWRRYFNCRYLADTLVKFGQHLLFIPKAAATIIRMHSALVTAYFQNGRLARITARNTSEASIIAANIRTETLQWHLENSVNPLEVLDRSILDTLVDSTSCIKVGWVRKFDPQGQMIENRLDWETIPIEDVFWDPDARFRSQLRYVIHMKEVDADYLRERALDPVTGYDPKAVEEIIARSHTGANTGRDDATVRQTGSPQNSERKPIWIRECWYKNLQMVPENVLRQMERGQGFTEMSRSQPVVITVFEKSVILRGPELNPYGEIPFFFPRVMTDKQELRDTIAGKGPMSLFEAPQSELNAIRNQRRTAAKRAMQGRLLVERGAGFDLEQLENYRNSGIVYVNKITGAKELKMDPPGSAADGELALNDADFQTGSGVTDEIQGIKPQGKDTASASNNRVALGTSRLGTMLQVYNVSGVEPMIRFSDKLCGIYETEQHITTILGSPIPVPPKFVIWGDEVNVEIEGGTNVIPVAQQLQEINMVAQTWMPMVQVVPDVAVPLLIGLAKRQLHILPGDFKSEEAQIEQAMGVPRQPISGDAGPALDKGTNAGPGQMRSTPPAPLQPTTGNIVGGMTNAAA